jgi:hypothetical protein
MREDCLFCRTNRLRSLTAPTLEETMIEKHNWMVFAGFYFAPAHDAVYRAAKDGAA